MLRAEQDLTSQLPVLIGALVAVAPDADSIAAAKEVFRKHRLLWVLIRLLHAAPDEESVATAIDCSEIWMDSSIEPEMLHAILSAQPDNKRIRRRAIEWLKKNPKDSWAGSIKQVLDPHRG